MIVIALVGTAIFGAFPPSGAQAAEEAAPVWRISQVPMPTNFMPGATPTSNEALPHYSVQIENLGGGASLPGATITDTMSLGIHPVSGLEATMTVAENPNQPTVYRCPVPVGQTTSCTVPVAVPPEAVIILEVPVEVDSTPAPGVASNEVHISGGGVVDATNVASTTISSTVPAFAVLTGSQAPFMAAVDRSGAPAIDAGSHPYTVAMEVAFPSRETAGTIFAAGSVKDLSFSLPNGVVFNPQATAVRCTEQQLNSENSGEGCPPASQVGNIYLASVVSNGSSGLEPLYNMVPPPGSAAELAFGVKGVLIHVQGGISGEFRLTAKSQDILAKVGVFAIRASLWGDPTDPVHDALRFGSGCVNTGRPCTTPRLEIPTLTMPTSCGSTLEMGVTASSWEGATSSGTSLLSGPSGEPVAMTDCGALPFEPTMEASPTTKSGDSPTGLQFRLDQTQDESLNGRVPARLKDVSVALPEGVSLNPAAAGGRVSCSPGQIGLQSARGVMPVRFDQTPQGCPNASKIGTAAVTTPLLKEGPDGERVPHVLHGSVYLAKPFDNPFGSLLAIYLVIEDEETGIIVKLAGEVQANSTTGQLTTTFKESPDLPLEDIVLSLFGGPRAALTTPLICGARVTTSVLTPWSTPEGADAHLSSPFETQSNCYASESQAPKDLSFGAGTVSPLAGSFSPFVLRLARADGTQHISGLETTLPEGLLGRLAGVTYCPEPGMDQAVSREQTEGGKLEEEAPSCPASSEVGTVNITAGSGSNPVPVSGHAYLAGPYKGAPLSLVVIVPAVAGPFDLGTVVDRVALNIGEYDARIHAVADPFPTIRDGIPLDVRSIELSLGRPSFTLNPTSCEEKAIEGSVSTQAGQSASVRSRFQVGECGRLRFRPKVSLSLSGAMGRTGHPALKATVTYPKKGSYANIGRAQVALPHAEFLHQSAIAAACTKVLLAAHACPKKSIYGKAKAWTPLLEKPLEGPVYLVGGYGYKLPALVAELNGQIRVLLVGKVDTGKSGGIRNTFESVPDAPVKRFVLQIHGGKNGLLENSENICQRPRKAGAAFTAQNRKTTKFAVKISNSCKGRTRGKK